MSYPSDVTNEQWALLEPVLNPTGKRGPKHSAGPRKVVHAMTYISHTDCRWRYLPATFGPWTRVCSQFRRCGIVGRTRADSGTSGRTQLARH